jgi:hypothetical protein
MVRTHPDPPFRLTGGLAQLGEHLLCKQGVVGSIPSTSTKRAVVILESTFKSWLAGFECDFECAFAAHSADL